MCIDNAGLRQAKGKSYNATEKFFSGLKWKRCCGCVIKKTKVQKSSKKGIEKMLWFVKIILKGNHPKNTTKNELNSSEKSHLLCIIPLPSFSKFFSGCCWYYDKIILFADTRQQRKSKMSSKLCWTTVLTSDFFQVEKYGTSCSWCTPNKID